MEASEGKSKQQQQQDGETARYDIFRTTGLFKLDSISRFVDHSRLPDELCLEREDSDSEEEAPDDTKNLHEDQEQAKQGEEVNDEEEKKTIAKFSNRKFKGLAKEKSPLELIREQKARKSRHSRKEGFEVVFVYVKHPGKSLGAHRIRFGKLDPQVRDSEYYSETKTREKMYQYYEELITTSEKFNLELFQKTGGLFNPKFWEVNVLWGRSTDMKENLKEMADCLKNKQSQV